MMVDWTKPLCTKHETPLVGEVVGEERGIKRVLLASLSMENGPPTVYRFDADGSARQGAGPSEYDLVNFDERDGQVRMTKTRRKVVCDGQAVFA